MGVQASFRFPSGAVPPWVAIRAALADSGDPPVVRMIDGLPAFPDEVPPEGWTELRIGRGGAMITLLRGGNEIDVVAWGTADTALDALRGGVGRALAALGGIRPT